MRSGMQHDRLLRVLVEPARSGTFQMQRDRELLETQAPGAGPTLRLYTWRPWCVSLGAMQRIEAALDLEACRAAGVDVVQRPTGGRSILHAEEITYALVASTADDRFGKNLADSHRIVGEALAAGLQSLGVAARLSRPELDPDRRLLRQPCFASPGRAEILVQGRKLLGSAQRRQADAFLQHGSLLLGPAHEGLVDLLLVQQETERAPMRARLRRDTITLHEILDPLPHFEDVVEALVAGFTANLGLHASFESPGFHFGTPRSGPANQRNSRRAI